MSQGEPKVLVLRGDVPPEHSLARMRVRFAPTRTTILAVRILEPSGWDADDEFSIEGFDAVRRSEAALLDVEEGGPVSIEVTYEGEAPQPLEVFIDGPGGKAVPSWHPDDCSPCVNPGLRVLERLWRLEVERLAVPVKVLDTTAPTPTLSTTVFAERLKAVDRDQLLRQAFRGHDEDTNPALTTTVKAQELDELNDELGARVEYYAYAGRKACKFVQLPLGSNALSFLPGVSAGFRATFEQLQLDDPHQPAVDLFDWAFEHFVTGALVTRHNDLDWQRALLGHGAPNSTFFLRFAMLAVVCVENGVDDDFWALHLRSLVRAAHIFLESACPMVDFPYPAEEQCYRFFPDRYFPLSRREELRAEYATGVGAGQAWSDEFNSLRGRLASLFALALDLGAGVTATKIDIPPDAFATLKAHGVGDPVRHAPC